MSQNISDPSHIERDLEQTRTRLNTHLSELQQRMTPGQVVDDLMRYFRGKEGAEFGRNLVESVRGNPLPAAITGIGLTWLMASNPRPAGQTPPPRNVAADFSYRGAAGTSHGSYEATTARVRTAEQGVTRGPDEAEHVYAGRVDVARGQALGLARHSDESTESFSDRVRSALASAQQAVAGTAHSLRDQAGGVAGSLGHAVQGAGQSIGGAAQRAGGAMAQGGQSAGKAGGTMIAAVTESPVLLGALGLAAGALLGALLPQLEQEEAALQAFAGQARDAAKGMAQDAVDKSGHVAQAVLDKSGDSIQAHGLAGAKGPGALVDAALSGDLAKDIKQAAAEILQTGDEAVRREALGKEKDASKPA
jgi:hypothetical protein